MKRWFFVLSTLAMSFPAFAADKDGEFYVRGIGSRTCATYVEERSKKSPRYYMFRSWLNGYVTAFNHLTPNTYDAAPKANIDGLATLLGTNCRKFPNELFWAVAFRVLAAFEPQRLEEKSEVVSATLGDQTVTVFQATLQAVQQALKERGYYDGAIDGQFSPNTHAALEAFQRDHALAVTGLPDQRTVFTLLP